MTKEYSGIGLPEEARMTISIINDILKKAEHLDLSASGLSVKSGLSQSYLTQLKSGSKNMNLRTLIKLCRSLNCTPKITIVEDYSFCGGEALKVSQPSNELAIQYLKNSSYQLVQSTINEGFESFSRVEDCDGDKYEISISKVNKLNQ
jgi:DNA-binding Xre family transcriptional regulator